MKRIHLAFCLNALALLAFVVLISMAKSNEAKAVCDTDTNCHKWAIEHGVPDDEGHGAP